MPPIKRLPTAPDASQGIKRFLTNTREGMPQDNDADQSDTDDSVAASSKDHEAVAPEVDTKTDTRNFQHKWLQLYPWLRFDDDKNSMHCYICRELGFRNTLALGTNNYCTSTLSRHVTHAEHKRAVKAPEEKKNLEKTVQNVATKEEGGIMIALEAVYWLCKEAIPLSKYTSLIKFLGFLNVPGLDALKYYY